MEPAIEKLLKEHLALLNEQLAQLIEINTKILHLVEFPVKMIWSAENGWESKVDLEQKAVEDSKRFVRRLARRRPSEWLIRDWLNEY